MKKQRGFSLIELDRSSDHSYHRCYRYSKLAARAYGC